MNCSWKSLKAYSRPYVTLWSLFHLQISFISYNVILMRTNHMYSSIAWNNDYFGDKFGRFLWLAQKIFHVQKYCCTLYWPLTRRKKKIISIKAIWSFHQTSPLFPRLSNFTVLYEYHFATQLNGGPFLGVQIGKNKSALSFQIGGPLLPPQTRFCSIHLPLCLAKTRERVYIIEPTCRFLKGD